MHGAAADLDRGSVSNASDLWWRMEFDQGDNNDGITVFDLTDPGNVKYCFVHWEPEGNFSEDLTNDTDVDQESRGNPNPRAPLTARDYLKTYNETRLGAEIQRLEKFSIITEDSLMEAWTEGRLEAGPFLDSSFQNVNEGVKFTTPSLVKLATKEAIERLLAEDDDLQEKVEELPGFLTSLREYIYEHPEVVSTKTYGFDMLQRALAGMEELDLHLFPELSAEQVSDLVDKSAPTITMLDISGNHNIFPEHLSMLSKNRTIQCLYIWNNNALPAKNLPHLPSVCTIMHREDFLRAFISYKAYQTSNHLPEVASHETHVLPSRSIASYLIFLRAHNAGRALDFTPGSEYYDEIMRQVQTDEANIRAGTEISLYPLVMPLDDVASCNPEELLNIVETALKAHSCLDTWFNSSCAELAFPFVIAKRSSEVSVSNKSSCICTSQAQWFMPAKTPTRPPYIHQRFLANVHLNSPLTPSTLSHLSFTLPLALPITVVVTSPWAFRPSHSTLQNGRR